MSEKKRLSDMSYDEQIAFYQKKAAAVKAKMVKEANAKYQLIGKIVSEVFTDMPEAENELKAYFTGVFEAYSAPCAEAENTASDRPAYVAPGDYQAGR